MKETIVLTESLIKKTVGDMMYYRGGLSNLGVSDLDDLTTPGSYLLATTNIANLPEGCPTYGNIIVYPGYYPLQEIQPTSGNYFYRRMKTASWTKWRKVSMELV